jgi:hypothetical protein
MNGLEEPATRRPITTTVALVLRLDYTAITWSDPSPSPSLSLIGPTETGSWKCNTTNPEIQE